MDVDVGTAAATDALKALGEPRRWQIVELLSGEELCVCHLAEDLAIPQPLVSHHLRVLRDAGLVESQKHRQWTYYRLRSSAIEELGDRIRALAACCPTPGSRRRPCE
jgi:ArsR family transcriptional regulator